jgi:phosphatidate cytidylyltransferase
MGWVGSKAILEYYALAVEANQGDCRPAKKCGTFALCAMIATACGTAYGLPFAYTDCVLPLTYVLILGYMMFLKRSEKATIADVQTTFMGIFYVGYLSSFWVRLRALGVIPATEVYSMLFTGPSSIISSAPMWFNPDVFTQGAIVTWWTMISIASSDVGAYFTGKNMGKTKLSDWIGITISPNKTKEGFLGGVALCSAFTLTGARLMQWPLWYVTGAIYGIMLGSLGLLGDLTVSLFKRDAGVKDTGNLLPGHGGLLDRIDSYMLTGMPAYYFVKYISQWMGV